MDPLKTTRELARLLGEPERDFDKEPITNAEGHQLMVELFDLIGDPEVSEELAVFYMTVYDKVKQYVLLS